MSGNAVLNFFAISQGAFVTMGGIVLFLTGISMLTGSAKKTDKESKEERSWLSVAIVPLAIPLLAGPGSISTVIVYAGQHDESGHKLVIGVVIFAVVIATYALLRAGQVLTNAIGATGLEVFEKIMGMIVLAIAVEFLYDGFSMHFPGFTTVHD